MAQTLATADQSLAVLSNGTVATWGAYAAFNGTVGTLTSPQVVTGLDGVVAVSAGGAYSLALKSDGTVWSWGFNNLNQLGQGITTTGFYPPGQIPGLSGITAISAGQDAARALKNDGTIWSWGNDATIKDGVGGAPVHVLTDFYGTVQTGFTAVSSGSDHTLALKSDGTVWSWGLNNVGQTGTAFGANYPQQVVGNRLAGFLTGITAIAAGNEFSLALASDGTVWGWGANYNGELGIGSTPTASRWPVQIPSLSNIASLTVGTSNAFAIGTDGSVWAWGDNHMYASLGDGTTIDRNVPVRLNLPPVVALGGGPQATHILALQADGTVVAWGRNSAGELGTGPGPAGGFESNPKALMGLGAVSSVPSGLGCSGAPQISLSVTAPPSLNASEWTYSPNPFTVSATVQNTGIGPAHGVQLAISIPAATDLTVIGSGPTIDIGDLAPGAYTTQTWQVRAGSRDTDTTWSYSVSATARDAQTVTSTEGLSLPKMKSALIFIPGLAGSELSAIRDSSAGMTIKDSNGQSKSVSYSNGSTVWVDVGKFLFDAQFFGVMRFGTDGNPLYNDFRPDGQMITINGGFYAGVEDFFTGPGAYTKGKDFFVFTYDWRYEAQSNVGALDALVSNVLDAGAPSVDIVSHSMGTQVTRAWLLKGAHRARINHVVLLAPPNLGTPKGTYTALAGTCLGPFCSMPAQVVKYIFTTIPGGFDQAVSPNYWAFYDGHDKAHPVPFIDRQVTPNRTDYQDLRARELATGAIPSALGAGEAFHTSDLFWPQNVSGKLSLFVGTGHCTLGQITADPRVPTRFGVMPPRYNYGEINGDGTVVQGSASMGDGTLGGGHLSIYYRHGTHEDMGHKGTILMDVLDVLRDRPVDQGKPSGTWPFCAAVSARSPMELQVTDAAGNHLGGLTPDAQKLDIPGGNFDRFNDMKVATIENPGVYHVELAGTGFGDSTIEVRIYQDPNGLTTNNVFHVPTTPQSKGSFTYDRTTGAVGPMTLDLNGDGKTLLTLQPTVLTGAAGGDTTPPALTIGSPANNQAVVGSFLATWTATDSESGVKLSLAGLDLTTNPQILTAPRTVQLPAGQHSMDAFAMDNADNYSLAHVGFSADAFTWVTPAPDRAFRAHPGDAVSVGFTVTTAAGVFVTDTSVQVDLVNEAGATVAGPLAFGQAPNAGVTISGGLYHATLPTQGLGPGTYSVRVRFNSPALVGQSTVSLELN